MSQTVITQAFVEWKARQAADSQPVTLDEFIFAFVPDQDDTKPIDNTEAIPTDKVVYRQAVSKTGVVNANAVVYSVTMGADVGDFDFNWIGLTNKASGTLAMIIHAPAQRKVQNASGQQGNVLVRSMLMEYSGAQAASNITTPAETWQIDFTARLAGMDETVRLAALDIYGAGAFFDSGFLVAKSGAQYFVTKGLGYVGGLRAALAANQNVAVSAKPTKVWADVSYQGTLTSAYKTAITFTVTETLENHTTDGVAHYVFALASIDAAGAITDLRPKGSLADQTFLRKDKNLTDIDDPETALKTLGGVPDTRTVNKKQLSKDINLTPDDVGAVPSTGGHVGYLENATHYSIKAGSWEGSGSFFSQLSNPEAPFIIPPGFSAPKDVSSYAPIIKGLIQTQGLGWATAISFGAYTTGGGNHAQACINVVGDNGVSRAWMFDPTDGTFGSPGHIVAGIGLYESGGNVRVYSPNNKPTNADVGLGNVGNYAAVHAGGGVGMNKNEVYIGWTGSRVKIQVDASDMGEIYTTGFPPPQPDLSPYATTQWVNNDLRNDIYNWCRQNFVQDTRFGTSAEYQERSNNEHIDGGVMTSFKDAGSSNYWIRVRPLQKLINGNWYTVSYT